MLALQHDEAHLWLAACGCDDAQTFAGLLSDDERRRAAGFATRRLADESVIQRATLRSVLAAYLDQAPAEIAIVAEAQGKPVLAQRGSNLAFNLSHSGDWLLIGVARKRHIGVDIQIERANTRCLDLARRFFAEDEAQMLAVLPPDEQTRRFFALWTLKEAYLKATGEGISGGLHRVRITLNERGEAQLADADARDQWQLRRLDVCDNYAAAMAIEDAGVRVRCARWRLGQPAPHAQLLRDGFR